jgi:hypothetical protein
MGFRMTRYPLSSEALPYRVLGKDLAVEISIQLPGTIRIEHIEGSRHSAAALAAAIPIDDRITEVHYCLYWTPEWLNPLRPLARWLTREFLRQDRDVANKLASHGRHSISPTVGDPDAQVRWYYQLKREYLSADAQQRTFVNPLRPATLSWRS